MSQTRVLTVERPYDYLYDRIYQVAGERDHARATIYAASKSQQIVSQPIYDGMFSELKHHPRANYVMNTKDMVPKFVNRFWTGIRRGNEAAEVGGRDRFRYFRRPVIPYATHLPPDVVLAAAEPQNLVSFISEEISANSDSRALANIFSGVKNVSTQTIYRESETQTDAYSPDYVIRPGEMPEVLTLGSLTVGHGLPGGLHEVEMIERARRRRQLESELPPLEDLSQAEKRMRMMEAIEREEWQVREQQIEELQQLRLEVLIKLLKHREETHQEMSNQKLDRLWNRKQKEKEKYFYNLRLKHVKALRQLLKRFKNVENKHYKRDIVNEYNDTGSQTWAPLTRIGQFIDRNNNREFVVSNSFLNSYSGLCELENTLPNFIFNPQMKIPRKVLTTKAGFKKRKFREEEKLSELYKIIKEDVEIQQVEEKPLRFLVKIEKPIPRPPTPTIEDPHLDEENAEKAVIMIQQLIRGKAVQAMMFEGKEKRNMLIDELRSTHSLLTHELELNKKDKSDTLNLQRQRVLLEHRENRISEELSVLEGESMSQVFDYLSKELIRLQEERKMHAIFMRAERERRIREAEESGLRQLEERRRREQDEIFKQVVKMHQSSVDKYLEEIIETSCGSTAEEAATKEIERIALEIHQQALENEKNNTRLQQENIVGDLIHNFLIPEVYKESMKERVEKTQHKFLEAAHREIVGLTDEVTSLSASARATIESESKAISTEEPAKEESKSDEKSPIETSKEPVETTEDLVIDESSLEDAGENAEEDVEYSQEDDQQPDQVQLTIEMEETINYNEADDTTMQDFSEMLNENSGEQENKEEQQRESESILEDSGRVDEYQQEEKEEAIVEIDPDQEQAENLELNEENADVSPRDNEKEEEITIDPDQEQTNDPVILDENKNVADEANEVDVGGEDQTEDNPTEE